MPRMTMEQLAAHPNFARLVLAKPGAVALKPPTANAAPCKLRIRQDSKPLMNKLEAEWLLELNIRHPGSKIYSQQWRVKIGNGAWFKVDHCAFIQSRWTAWECKGPKQMKNVARGMLALKSAATQFPDVDWFLAWKESGEWKEQKVLP